MQTIHHHFARRAMLVFFALASDTLRAETTPPSIAYQLYGSIDAGMAHTRIASSATGTIRHAELHGSGHDDTRFGLRGRETLPGGQQVQFTLEALFDSDSGGMGDMGDMGASAFNLQSWLGISDAIPGELRLGRQATIGQDFIADLAIGNWKDFGIDALLRAADSTATVPHIRWHSPAGQGWQAGISYSPHGTPQHQRMRSAAVRHENGAWHIAASVEQGARLALQEPLAARLRPRAWHIGLHHEGENVHLAAAWSQMRNGFVARNGGNMEDAALDDAAADGALQGLGPAEFIQGGRLHAGYLALAVPVGAGEWQVQYARGRPRWHWQASGAAARSIHVLSFGYLHALSPRTRLYAYAAAGKRYDMATVASAANPRSRRLAWGLAHHF